ncbi:hypothetical protein PhCBS80983_g04006 [Powellomyces hirtus]|uniref:Uncharacterized protein n=1 Tax=Powellomyces hirtus TaxID=109895 RepID=A0A507E030_9FUNG|nr:hypothetical protein PhCBS80983_g04006 [Powellomyces hirtus]
MSKDQPSTDPSPDASATTTFHSTDALLTAAQKALDDCHPDLALKFLHRAHAQSPTHPRVLVALGVCEMERMNAFEDDAAELDPAAAAACAEAARTYFEQAAACSGSGADELYEQYLYLGQLSAGEEALRQYRKGVHVLEKCLQRCKAAPPGSEQQQEEEKIVRRKLSDALSSMAEIYMTDCCDLDDAEAQCEALTHRATTADPSNPEAHLVLASMRLSQCRPDDAIASISTSMDLWFSPPSSSASSSSASSSPPSQPQPQPPYPARINLVKILLELSLHDRALAVLRTLEEENDEDPEAWYLYGWCLYRMGGGRAGADRDADDDDEQEMDEGGDSSSNAVHVEDAEKADAWAEASECFEHFMQVMFVA